MCYQDQGIIASPHWQRVSINSIGKCEAYEEEDHSAVSQIGPIIFEFRCFVYAHLAVDICLDRKARIHRFTVLSLKKVSRPESDNDFIRVTIAH